MSAVEYPNYAYSMPDMEWLKEQKEEVKNNLAERLTGKNSIYKGVRLSKPDIKQTYFVNLLKNELQNGLKCFYMLLGDVGCGKTFAALALAAEIGTPNCRFLSSYKLSEFIFRKNFEALDKAQECLVLVIDDLGAEPEGFKGKDFLAFFEELFNQRYTKQLTTIITSNLTSTEIKEQYGERFVSRFNQYGEVFQSTEADLRKEANS